MSAVAIRRRAAGVAALVVGVGMLVAALAVTNVGFGVLVDLCRWFADPARWHGPDGIPVRLFEHLGYVFWSMLMGMAVALPLGIGLGHIGRGGLLVINVSNVGRAIPSFGVIILVFMLAGFGVVPILVALTALAIPPMVTNSYVGMRSVDPAICQAARATGMTAWQTLWTVELPIALPLVMAGLRTSAVQVVSTATLAAYVGLGGLGRYLIDGLATRQMTAVLGGAIVVALLAIVTEAVLAWVQKRIVSAGLVM